MSTASRFDRTPSSSHKQGVVQDCVDAARRRFETCKIPIHDSDEAYTLQLGLPDGSTAQLYGLPRLHCEAREPYIVAKEAEKARRFQAELDRRKKHGTKVRRAGTCSMCNSWSSWTFSSSSASASAFEEDEALIASPEGEAEPIALGALDKGQDAEANVGMVTGTAEIGNHG